MNVIVLSVQSIMCARIRARKQASTWPPRCWSLNRCCFRCLCKTDRRLSKELASCPQTTHNVPEIDAHVKQLFFSFTFLLQACFKTKHEMCARCLEALQCNRALMLAPVLLLSFQIGLNVLNCYWYSCFVFLILDLSGKACCLRLYLTLTWPKSSQSDFWRALTLSPSPS